MQRMLRGPRWSPFFSFPAEGQRSLCHAKTSSIVKQKSHVTRNLYGGMRTRKVPNRPDFLYRKLKWRRKNTAWSFPVGNFSALIPFMCWGRPQRVEEVVEGRTILGHYLIFDAAKDLNKNSWPLVMTILSVMQKGLCVVRESNPIRRSGKDSDSVLYMSLCKYSSHLVAMTCSMLCCKSFVWNNCWRSHNK